MTCRKENNMKQTKEELWRLRDVALEAPFGKNDTDEFFTWKQMVAGRKPSTVQIGIKDINGKIIQFTSLREINKQLFR